MPPESKMEDLLKASAAARRAEFGPDPKMPNPMRARLHDEIARLGSDDERAPSRSWLNSFWPQLSVVSAVAAMLMTAAVLWPDHQKSFTGNSSIAMRAPVQTESASAPAALASPAVPSEPGEQADVASARIAQSEVPQEQSAQPAAAPSVQHYAATESNGVAKIEQQSARGQAMRNNSQLKQSTKILDNFEVEQNGRDIRLVDADGSTYTGTFVSDAPSGRRRMAALKTKTVSRSPASNERFFRASGFNTSLQKRVVFEGNYIPESAEEQKKPADKKSAFAQQPSARIVGRAQVPGESPVEVDASAVVP